MSSSLPINQGPDLTAPTPQNTPLQHAPITAGLSRPTVPDITEGDEPEEESPPDTTTLKGALAGLVHGRLAGLLGKSSGYIENLPTDVKRSLEGLKGLQVKQTALQNQYKMECLELEKKACLCDYRFFFLDNRLLFRFRRRSIRIYQSSYPFHSPDQVSLPCCLSRPCSLSFFFRSASLIAACFGSTST